MTDQSRRSMLALAGVGLAGLAVGAVGGIRLGRSDIVGTAGLLLSSAPKTSGIISTHNHMIPDFYARAASTPWLLSELPTGKLPEWTPAMDLEIMDKNNIQKVVISASAGLGDMPQPQTNALARRVNEFGARLMADHPKRYGQFAILPLPDIDSALAEAEYALGTLKAQGLIIFTDYNGKYLGDPHFEPLWAELDRRNAVVFVHPTKPSVNPTNIPDGVMEFVFDTTRTCASLIFSGASQRYGNIRWIFSHGGGTVPYIVDRLGGATHMIPGLKKTLPDGVMGEIRKFYWDTALTFTAASIKCLLTVTDSSKVLFGTDWPFVPGIIVPLCMKSLNNLGLPEKDLKNIMSDTALRLMPSLA